MIGVQFNKPGADVEKISVNDLVKLSENIEPGLYDDDFATAPQIQVLNEYGGYDYYFYASDATDLDDEPLGYNCWCDLDGYGVAFDEESGYGVKEIDLGLGFWFKSPTAGTISVAGEVKAEADAVKNFPANQFYILSNPFPVAFSLLNVTTTGVMPGLYDDDFATAPQIQVLNEYGGYDYYFYASDATDLDDEPLGYNCWCDLDGYGVAFDGEYGVKNIEAGASFWIKANAAGTLGFSR